MPKQKLAGTTRNPPSCSGVLRCYGVDYVAEYSGSLCVTNTVFQTHSRVEEHERRFLKSWNAKIRSLSRVAFPATPVVLPAVCLAFC